MIAFVIQLLITYIVTKYKILRKMPKFLTKIPNFEENYNDNSLQCQNQNLKHIKRIPTVVFLT